MGVVFGATVLTGLLGKLVHGRMKKKKDKQKKESAAVPKAEASSQKDNKG